MPFCFAKFFLQDRIRGVNERGGEAGRCSGHQPGCGGESVLDKGRPDLVFLTGKETYVIDIREKELKG